MRSSGWLAAGLATGLLTLTPTATAAPTYAFGEDCQEHQAFVQGDEAAVAARLPERYKPVRDEGRPLVFARGLRCRNLTIGGRTGPATMGSYGVVIESPDGKGCGSATPAGSVKGDNPPLCNWYTLAWVTDDRRVVDVLRDGTPGYPAVLVGGLVFEAGAADAQGGAPFHFQAPAPSPSPFTIDDVAHERPGELAVRGGYWTDTPQGTVKLALSTDDLTAGDANGVVRAAPGSELAKLMGGDERPYAASQSGFSAVRARHGIYRKQVLGSAREGEALDSFAGSCSVKGDVAFDPPATNLDQSLTYAYAASGSCTGTLNGRALSDAPVRLQHSGRADGGCLRARTIGPSEGAMTFADGTSIGYTLDFTFAGTEGEVELYGDRSGTAHAHATFATDRTPSDITAQCAGAGVRRAPMDATFSTETPLVAGRSAPSGRVASHRLRLSASPRRVAAGRRTRFAFRVTTADGRAVDGATVRFAGRRARTGRRGTVTIGATLHRPGLRAANASKRGFRAGRASIRVRR